MLDNGGLSMKVLTKIMNEYAKEHGYFYINQGGNDNNPLAHYNTTGPEIWEDTEGKVDYVVQLVGTGGTLAGLSKFMKEKNPDVKIIGAQPAKHQEELHRILIQIQLTECLLLTECHHRVYLHFLTKIIFLMTNV